MAGGILDKEYKTLKKRLEKKKKDNLSTKQKSTPSDSLSLTESLLDKSHFSITDSASQSYRSQFSESESFREEETQITTQMREAYPELYRLLRKASKRGVLHLPQVRFRNSNLIRGTLFQMKHAGYIEGEIKQDKISVNKVGDHPIAFRAHTTHGSGSYAKWYHNPEVVLNYFIFLAQCDPVIKNYCQATFGEGCFSRDLEDGLGDTSRPD